MKNSLFSFILFFFFIANANGQCTPFNCSGSLPSYGGICGGDLNTGNVNQGYFDEESFVVTNACFDAGVISPDNAGTIIRINNISGFSFSGLPGGLSAATNQGNYSTSGGTNVGCMGVSGTPVDAGVFSISINFTATVAPCAFPIPLDVGSNFSIGMTILPDASFTGLGGSYCQSDGTVTLTATGTQGGSFSGPGVSGNTFNPGQAGPGTHTISYNVSAQQGAAVASAQNSSSQQVNVQTTATYYADTDMDSFGDPLSTTSTCGGPPSGFVDNNLDCDDADGNVGNVPPAGDPNLFGDNVWNVYAYNGRNYDLDGITYRGFYVEPTLSYDTRDRWDDLTTPSDASGYEGCAVGIDNHTLVSKRRGFPCDYYRIDVADRDDEAKLLINGRQVWFGGCCGASGEVWAGKLDENSTIEFRHGEGGGGSVQALDLIAYSPDILAGSVFGDTVVCPGIDPGSFAGMADTLPGFTYVGDHDGSQYYVSIDLTTDFSAALQAAAAAGGHLVAINDADENVFVAGLADQLGSLLIGFTDQYAGENDFYWIGLEPVTFTAWNSGEPNNIGGEDYAEIQGTGGWNDIKLFENPKKFLVEIPVAYQWETRIGTSGSFSSIEGEEEADYNPAILEGVVQFRRVATGYCGNTDYSNIITVDASGTGLPNCSQVEICDGIDNDGDMDIDEGFDSDGDGLADCFDTEECDGLDNDGDELIDEGFDSDNDGLADCFDTEECDSLDNNGNGQVDEGFDSDNDGLADCYDTEECDSLDNNGNGQIDEGFDSDNDGLADCYDIEECDGQDNDGDGQVDEIPGDPLVFGDNEWIVYGYNGRDLFLNSGSAVYRGFYTEAELSFNTFDRWDALGSPSLAVDDTQAPGIGTAWQGCSVDNDLHTVVSKRKGFECGYYTIDVGEHDDEVVLYVNGSRVFFDLVEISDYHAGAWNGYLNDSSTIEIRHADGFVGSAHRLEFSPADPPVVNTGSVSVGGDICPGTDPGPITGQPDAIPGFSYEGVYEGGLYYLSNDETTDFQFAQSVCAANGGDLVTISDADENAFVTGIAASVEENLLIGLTYQFENYNIFYWISGEVPDPVYTNWASGEPNGIGVEDNTELYYNSGEWNDIELVGPHRFVMEVKYSYQWEVSTDDGMSWSDVPGATGLNLDPPALFTETWYRRRSDDRCGNSAYSATVIFSMDSDNDGYAECEGDCNDDDPDINPGADEVCDGIDNDCDGDIDDDDSNVAGQIMWYLDIDEDGYGDPSNGILTCDSLTGYVTNSLDCDDDNENVNPDAEEVCDGIDNDCNDLTDSADPNVSGTATWYEDSDEDGFGNAAVSIEACDQPLGYVINNLDCNDDNENINPDADEVCDGMDNDCDGDIDDADGDVIGQTNWYLDNDDDSYGDPSTALLSCNQPMGYVSNNLDCNDDNENVNPDADEVCDGIDNDCNGNIDDDDSNVVGQIMWYLDSDEDSFGDAGVSLLSCNQPAGYVTNDLDCDDDNENVNPEAEEVCDGIDNDCNTLTDSADPNVSGTATWYEDSDEDGFGNTAVSIEACDQPLGYVINNLDCNDDNENINPDKDEVCDGMDNDCDGDIDDADGDVIGQTTWYLDNDNDSYGDPATALLSCNQPTGYVPNNLDCNDDNMNVNPDADEVCDGIDNDCNGDTDNADSGVTGQSTYYFDRDRDGYGDASTALLSCQLPPGHVDNGLDCDDNNENVNPDADEVCDGIDNDCNDLTDSADPNVSGTATWYEDSDEDGYGNPTVTIESCDQPAGYVINDLDCNDDNENINPDAVEVCDGIDNDCDGDTDDEDSGVLGQSIWYLDNDNDSYGDASVSVLACIQPSGYVSNDLDCNDSNQGVNPASDEVCDGIDNNCNGLTDSADPSVSGSATWYEDSDSDDFGNSDVSVVACDQPSGYVLNDADCNDGNPDINPGAVEVCDNIDNDCDGNTETGEGTFSIVGSDTLCSSDDPIDLSTFTEPAGGDYSGPGVSGVFFDPAAAGTGNHVLNYEVELASGCLDIVSANVTVVNCTGIQLYNDSENLSIYPNPFTSTATIDFMASYTGSVQIDLLNVKGEKVAGVFSGHVVRGGQYKVELQGGHNLPGIYFGKLSTAGEAIFFKLILVK